ncbi:ATP-dependent RNA helicase, putative [Plasmodium relictum]|uniref:ATP-dependent RNA helicase, putative n=1 Tax=Plasmodium relictum TaxID=85471 RepID=A0A1J1HDN0_PLARL|nr:ATP-dependent RNA helicase, putative [Plasmodium relictum]CRH03653.1 ATP-dependent RNA helicase, putative [Plasmodium relictum]
MVLYIYFIKNINNLNIFSYSRKLLYTNDFKNSIFLKKSLERYYYTTLKIINFHLIYCRNYNCFNSDIYNTNEISNNFYKKKNINRKNTFINIYNKKYYNNLSQDNILENNNNDKDIYNDDNLSNKNHFNNEHKKENYEKENGGNNYIDESIYSINNKILNRHEKIDINLLNIDDEIVNNLKFILKIDKLYMYQYIIYNEILKNSKHLLIYNKTGTGKTLSYLLPLIQNLINEKFDCNKKVLILTQNIYLCKQLYIYILSIYPNLNVCILFDENDGYEKIKKSKYDIFSKELSLNKRENEDLYKENYGIHFYLSTPNKLELYIKNYKNKKKNEKNVMNNILNYVNTIVVDEFDYIIENRKFIFNFLFSKNVISDLDNKRKNKNDFNYEHFNYEEYNIYLFTANMNDSIKKKINEYLNGFIFFDFINGIKEKIQKKIDDERSKFFKNLDNVIQILSKENKSSSLCNLNISHFICKINTPSKYKYVSYFLNEFFFLKNKKNLLNRNLQNIPKENLVLNNNNNKEQTFSSNDIIIDHIDIKNCEHSENEDKINKCIIFANSKDEVEKLYENSFLKPHSVMLHSELLTVQKDENINLFKLGKKTILITTDIVSRGLDIENVIFILNYSPPTSPNDYIHRSGRTGRAKERGTCLTIYHKYEYKNLEKIIKYTRNKFQVILCPHVDEVYKFSVDKLTEIIMKVPQEKYEFLNEKAKELLKNHNTKIIAQILSILLKLDKKKDFSILSGKKNYVAVFIKDPFFEVIKNKDDIINLMKVTTGDKNISNIIGEIAKCDEGYIVDISSSHVNKIINLFNSSNYEYKSKGVEINTIIELPPIIKEKKNILRKKRKIPWIKYKLQKKKIIILGRKTEKYKRKQSDEIIKDINKNISHFYT